VSHDRKFRFGVHTSDAASGTAWMDAARRYEDLGFSTLLLRDHFDQQLAPLAAMTAAACATESLRVSCLVFDNDYRHPLVLAKELATIDVLSQGRVEIGLGAGWMAPDYQQAGIPFDPPRERVSRLFEAVAIIGDLLGDGTSTRDGDHYSVDHTAYPTPVQRPRPPIMVAGGGPRMLRFAAQHADIVGLNPARKSNTEWEDQNLDDATAEATDRKTGWIREAAGDRYDDLELQIVVPFVVVTDDRTGTAEAIAAGLDARGTETPLTPENVLASPYTLIGTEDEICDTLNERRQRWDLSYVVFNDDAVEVTAPIVQRLAGT
jgi:probable F420-dependent oxidoreductase